MKKRKKSEIKNTNGADRGTLTIQQQNKALKAKRRRNATKRNKKEEKLKQTYKKRKKKRRKRKTKENENKDLKTTSVPQVEQGPLISQSVAPHSDTQSEFVK